MRFSELKQDKGVAGLTILLSLIAMLFVMGLLITIFALMGGEMIDATYTSTDATTHNESGWLNGTGYTLANSGANGITGLAVSYVWNATSDTVIASGNYSLVAGVLTNLTSEVSENVTITYTYTWDANNTGTDVMSATVSGIGGTTDWFAIFIVIGAMVVLILLTVIIITAIRGSGLMVGGTTPMGRQNIGSA